MRPTESTVFRNLQAPSSALAALGTLQPGAFKFLNPVDSSVSLSNYYIYISAKKIRIFFFYLSKYSLSDIHFNTGRLLFEFNRLQYTLAAPEIFVSSANPVSLPSGYRVSIVRNTNIDQIETTPLRYCMLHA